ncbi:tetratricopeptide repeat protein [Bacillus cereus]|nr:tetratricopeptide repeat protein [Bacillus cereus]
MNDFNAKTIVQRAERDIYNANKIEVYYLNENKEIIIPEKRLGNKPVINYYEQLLTKYSTKKLLIRDKYKNEIEQVLEEVNEVLVYGEPGVGKTAILTQISGATEFIYLSLNRFSTLGSILYLVNSIRNKRKIESLECGDIEEAISALEQELVGTNLLFLIDDCQKNIDIISSLMSIEKFNNKFIFVSRIDGIFSRYAIPKIKITPFNSIEVEKYLEINGVELNAFRINEIANISNGNPLYLEYFLKYTITPIPRGLEAFQRAIWEDLDDISKSIIAATSLTLNMLTQEDLLCFINKIHQTNLNFLELNKILSTISGLIDLHNGQLDVSHPYFAEFIRRELSGNGLGNWYRKELGGIFFEQKNMNEAVHLLLDIEDDKIYSELLEVFPYYIELGFYNIAISVLQKFNLLHKERESVEVGYTYYHLSNCYRQIGDLNNAKRTLKLALQTFEGINNESWIIVCQVWLILDLVEDGNLEEAKELCKEISKKDIKNKHINATVLVNLSKFYIDTFDFKTGADISKKAFELFNSLEEESGIIASLVNLSICLMKLEKLDSALEYCEVLYEISNRKGNDVLKASVLNNMTICYRKLGKTSAANSACLECIGIWSKLDNKHKIAMNLLNLGNVYRDIKDYENARKYYLEGLEMAQEIGLVKEEGRGYELLSHLERQSGNLMLSLEYADKAILVSDNARDLYRVAEAWNEKAVTEHKLGRLIEAANSYKEALKIDRMIKQNDEVLENVIAIIRLYEDNEMREELKNFMVDIKEIIYDNSVNVELSGIDYFMEQVIKNFSKEYVEEIYLMLFNNAQQNNLYIHTYFILHFLDFRKHNVIPRDGRFKEIILQLISSIEERRYGNIIALMLEQSGRLLNKQDSLDILDVICETTSGIYYRIIDNDDLLVTVSWENGTMFQIRVMSEEDQTFKICIVVALIIKINEDLFNMAIQEYKESYLTLYIYEWDLLTEEIKQELLKSVKNNPSPVIFLQSSQCGEYGTMIIMEDYYKKSCYNHNPENKVFIFNLMMLFNILYSHFTHSKIDVAEHSNFRRTLVNRVFDNLKVTEESKILDDEDQELMSKEQLEDLFRNIGRSF